MARDWFDRASIGGDPAAAAIVMALTDAAAGLIVLDRNGCVSFVNRRFIAALGLDGRASALGRPFRELGLGPTPPGREAAGDLAEATLSAASGEAVGIVWTRSADGGWTGAVAPGPARAPALAPRGRVDELTGLGDRAHLRSAFAEIASGGDADDVAALYIDLDRFKQVNDTLGHDIGDGLLKRAAQRLRQATRASDVLVRLGGDEFAALLVGPGASMAAGEVAARIVELISRPFIVGGHQIIVGASVGVAAVRPGELSPEELLKRADIALYRAKADGRGRWVWFEDGMSDRLQERRILETELRKALLLDQLRLVYQPQLAFESGAISGFEALLRWDHPTRGVVSPAEFLPVAEETGLIVQIGEWALREACREATTWPAPLTVAVNVAPTQFEREAFLDEVRNALIETGLEPSRLDIEITEASLLKDPEASVERMRAIRQIGVRLSLDDFGVGASSLNYLRVYPFDKIKIDQSFVREPYADAAAKRIVEAVAGLGQAFGMTVLAEGVETEEQLSTIRLQGCGAAQGYLLSRPLPADAVSAYLREARDLFAASATNHGA